MSRRTWTAVLAGVLGAMVLLGIAAGAYRLGRHDTVVRTVGEGEVVRVVGHGWGHGWGHGPGPGFLLLPLLLIGLVALLVWGRRGWGGGGGYCGPGRGSGPEDAFSAWHQRAHSEHPPAAASATVAPGGGPGETGPPGPTV